MIPFDVDSSRESYSKRSNDFIGVEPKHCIQTTHVIILLKGQGACNRLELALYNYSFTRLLCFLKNFSQLLQIMDHKFCIIAVWNQQITAYSQGQDIGVLGGMHCLPSERIAFLCEKIVFVPNNHSGEKKRNKVGACASILLLMSSMK